MTDWRTCIAAAALVALVAGCSDGITPGPDQASYAPTALSGDADLSRVRLSIMPTATAEAPEAALFEGGSWLTTRIMGHSAILVCHPQALLLFDTGLGRDVDAQVESMPFHLALLADYDVTSPAADQLAEGSFCPDRPLRIALSHLHWDHASGIEDFPGVPVWTRPVELTRARERKNDSGYLAGQIDAPGIDWRDLEFPDGPYESYDQSFDYFGDGVVVFVPLAGHTDGSVGMFVDLAAAGRYLFTGDTTWALEGFARPAHKHSLIRTFVDWEVERLEAEILRIHALMKRYPDLRVIPAHDYDAYGAAAIYPEAVGSD